MEVQSLDEIVRVARGTYKIITAAGEIRTVTERPTIRAISRDIGADTLDTVNLRTAHGDITGVVLLVDDVGVHKELPPNDIATRIYLRQCKPGTTHKICGDVVLVNDSDFA